MTYSSATDSYQADFLENILDTTYKYGIPYIIDREKYEAVMKEFKKEVRIKDANVVEFHADYSKEEDGHICNYTFFAFPKNSPEGSKDFYDCSQFCDDYDCEYKEKFEEFVHAVLECVVGIDVPTAMNLRDEKVKELRRDFKEIDNLDSIILPQPPHSLIREKADDSAWIGLLKSLQQEKSGVWVKIDAEHPLPHDQEVIAYNKEWVHEDFNPSGTRVGFLNDIGFISAKWVDDQDCYTTCSEEGDDYTISQILPDGTRKTWCKYENGEAVEGYLPNMPTHFMLIPNTPDGFTWPYSIEKR